MWWRAAAGVLCLAALATGGERVSGRWIVELTESPEAVSRVARPREQQVRLRRLIEQRRARVLGSVHTVANALIVDIADAEAYSLAAIPGVKRIYPVERMEIHLDRATAIAGVPQAWASLGGMESAGAGIKIAILDTGIQADHPGFQAPGMAPPAGYPQISHESNRQFTNNKIIVARSYEPSNPSVLDRHGHGTAVAMTAAGVQIDAPRGKIAGVAPKAWLGIYRVNEGSSGTIPSDRVLRAIEDAVVDGMDVINMSFGSVGYLSASVNLFRSVLDSARARGVIVVVSAGNSGSDPMSLDWTASIPEVLAVGATDSDRIITTPGILLDSGVTISALPATNSYSINPVTASLVTVAGVDPTEQVCAPLPEGTLAERAALVRTGGCEIESKLLNLQAAGALAAVLVAEPGDRQVGEWSAGSSTLAAWLVSLADGQRLRSALMEDSALQVTLRAYQTPIDPNRIMPFSSRGPTVDFNIKPDLVAVGARFQTAGQLNNIAGSLFGANGFVTTQGTSFSAPMVAGAAAVLKAARPALTSDDYRSLLVNGARELGSFVQNSGAGALFLPSSLASMIVAAPVSVSFGMTRSTFDLVKPLTLKNLSASTETFTLTLETTDALRPALTAETLAIPPSGTAEVALLLSDEHPAPGAYQGFLRIRSSGSPVDARVPYWFAVAGTRPERISMPGAPTEGTPNQQLTVRFRVQDPSGLPLFDPPPAMTVESGGGSVTSVVQEDFAPTSWTAKIRLGPETGNQVFQIAAGDVSARLTIRVR